MRPRQRLEAGLVPTARNEKDSQQSQERLGRCRFEDESLPFLAHDGVLSRKLKLAGNAYRLISTVPEELHMSFEDGSTGWHMPKHMPFEISRQVSLNLAENVCPEGFRWRLRPRPS